MDIIDIMLARAMTPQGKTEAYLTKAEKAAQKAAAAESSAAAAIQTVESAADEIATAREEAASLLTEAQTALETAQAAQINTLSTEDVDEEINKLDVSVNLVEGANANTYQVITTYPDNTLNTENATKMYKATGANEDGTMTQKAITDTLNVKADKTYVDTQIAMIPTSGSGTSNLGTDNSGKIVVIDANGNIISGTVLEEDIIQALIQSGGYTARDAVGLEIDYVNKSFTRTQQATNKMMGTDFDSYIMYGGRRRCTVNDDGSIDAFYGENTYTETNSSKQVMIYQPKFYYQRVPLQTEGNRVGKIINRDSIIISTTPQNGFKLHPLFINENGEEVDYVLLSAYEGSVYSTSLQGTFRSPFTSVDYNTDKMVSIANTKPITGTSDLTLARAEQLANNRGNGWHIFNMKAESANQMLELIEFGTLNGQAALGKGICDIETNGDQNQSALTGSTSSLGNTSGIAEITTFEHNDGVYFTETVNGKVAISYRGMENPWGNTWNMLGGILIKGTTSTNGGIPYICSDFAYSYVSPSSNYTSVEFSLPNGNGWISALGYGNKDYDWLLMPANNDSSANSALPIGDDGWFDANMNGNRAVVAGGSWGFGESDGPFYYGCDKQPNDTRYKSYGARLMFIPTKNTIYTENIAKWQREMNKGG